MGLLWFIQEHLLIVRMLEVLTFINASAHAAKNMPANMPVHVTTYLSKHVKTILTAGP